MLNMYKQKLSLEKIDILENEEYALIIEKSNNKTHIYTLNDIWYQDLIKHIVLEIINGKIKDYYISDVDWWKSVIDETDDEYVNSVYTAVTEYTNDYGHTLQLNIYKYIDRVTITYDNHVIQEFTYADYGLDDEDVRNALWADDWEKVKYIQDKNDFYDSCYFSLVEISELDDRVESAYVFGEFLKCERMNELIAFLEKYKEIFYKENEELYNVIQTGNYGLGEVSELFTWVEYCVRERVFEDLETIYDDVEIGIGSQFF